MHITRVEEICTGLKVQPPSPISRKKKTSDIVDFYLRPVWGLYLPDYTPKESIHLFFSVLWEYLTHFQSYTHLSVSIFQ